VDCTGSERVSMAGFLEKGGEYCMGGSIEIGYRSDLRIINYRKQVSCHGINSVLKRQWLIYVSRFLTLKYSVVYMILRKAMVLSLNYTDLMESQHDSFEVGV
jgi:hypothetical protein